MRSQLSLKSDNWIEGMGVDAAGISVKVGAHYPGRFVRLPYVALGWAPPLPRVGDGVPEIRLAKECRLMEAVVGRENRGTAGVDCMNVDGLWDYCKIHLSQTKADLLEDRH
jgi:hypothetical protein